MKKMFAIAFILLALANVCLAGDMLAQSTAVDTTDTTAILKRLKVLQPTIDSLFVALQQAKQLPTEEYIQLAKEWNSLVIKLKPDFARRRDPLRALRSSGWGFDMTGVEKSKLSNNPDAHIMRDKTTNKYLIKRKGETVFIPMQTVNDSAVVPIMTIIVDINNQEELQKIKSIGLKIPGEFTAPGEFMTTADPQQLDELKKTNIKWRKTLPQKSSIDHSSFGGNLMPDLDSKLSNLSFNGFESGMGGYTSYDAWSAYAGADYWGQSARKAYQGTYSCWCAQNASNTARRDSGYYNDYMMAYLESPNYDVSQYSNVQVLHRFWFNTEPNYDSLMYDIYDQFSSTWDRVAHGSGSGSTWTSYITYIEAYIGSATQIPTDFKFRFVFKSDGSIHNYEGAYIDNISVDGDLANLVPFTPSGWSAQIVVSPITGTNTDGALGTIVARKQVYLDWAYKNTGVGDARKSFWNDIYVKNSSGGWDFVGTKYTSSLISGAVDYYADFPYTSTISGTRSFKLEVDGSNYVLETSGSDNSYTKTVYFKPLPDLKPTSIYTNPSTPSMGQNCTINWGVQNTGDTTAYYSGGFRIYLYVGGNLADQKIIYGGLAAGASFPYATSYIATTGGNKNLTVRCDPENYVNEYDDTSIDNDKTITVYWNQPPNQCTFVSPVNGATNVSLDPVMRWSCTDPDGDAITRYQLQVDDNTDFSSPIYSNDNVTTTWCQPGVTMYRNTPYYWRVKGYDGKVWGPTGATWCFTTSNNQFYVSGTIQYYNEDDAQIKPIPRAKVQLFDYSISSTTPIVTDSSDATGFVNFWEVNASTNPQFHINISLENNICKVWNNRAAIVFNDTIVLDTVGMGMGRIMFATDHTDFDSMLINNACHIYDALYREYNWVNSNTGYWLTTNRPQISVIYNRLVNPVADTITCYTNELIYICRTRKHVRTPFNANDSLEDYRRYGPYHEYAHAIMYKAYGDTFPSHGSHPGHSVITISDTGFALMEGFAEFIPCAVKGENYLVDWVYEPGILRNAETNSWHKVETSHGDLADDVEGAVASVLYDLQDANTDGDESAGGVSGLFPTIFKVLKDKRPGGMRAFYDSLKTYYATDPSLASQDKQIRAIYKNHGIELPLPFVAGFEPGESPPYINNIPYSYGVTGVTTAVCGVDNGVVPPKGSYMYKISGQDANNVSSSYAYCKLYDQNYLNYQIKDSSYLTFWLYVKQSPGGLGHIFIDGMTVEGQSLRNCNVYDQNSAWVHASAHTIPNGQWMQYVIDLSPLVGQHVNSILLDYDDGNTSETGAFIGYVDDIRLTDEHPYLGEWYAECLSGHKNSTVSFNTAGYNGGAELVFNVVAPYDTVWVNWPSMRKDITDIAISPDVDKLFTWTQLDRAHALQFELLVKGADAVDRWLIYSANADNHWADTGRVDMGPRSQTYNTEETFTRNVSLDYYQEFGVKAALIKESRISHFAYTGWGPGNYGGIVKDVVFSDQDWITVQVQNQLLDQGNRTDAGTVYCINNYYQSPFSAGTRTAVGDQLFVEANNTVDYPAGVQNYFCYWCDGGAQRHAMGTPLKPNYTAFFKKKPSLSGYTFDGYSHLSWNWGAIPAGFPAYYYKLYNQTWVPTKVGEPGNGYWYWRCIYTGTSQRFTHNLGVNDSRKYIVNVYWNDRSLGSAEFYADDPVDGDPIISSTLNPDATAFSNGKKLAIDDNGKLHVTYTSGDTVFYATSSDDGETWGGFTPVGFGTNPAIELRTAAAKGANTASQTPSICYVNGNSLYLAEKSETGSWNQPQSVYQGQPDEEISYLSYVLNRQNNQAFVGWVSTTPSGSNVYSAPYAPGSGGGQLSPIIVDPGGGSTLFKSPSLAIARDGGLITAWSRDGLVKYSDPVEGTIELSEQDKISIHPIVSTYGDRTSVIWMEQTAPIAKNEPGRFQIVTRERTPSGWSNPQVISFPDSGDAQFPVAAAHGQYVYTKEYGDGNYDINYCGQYSNNWETHVQNISLNSGGQSGYPDVVFRPSWPKHKLYIVWTEVDTPGPAKILLLPKAKIYVKSIEPVPSYGVYPNTNEQSTYTAQRAGAFYYGSGQYNTVDYHPDMLIYHFDNLDPKMKYQVKAVYYWTGSVSEKSGHRDDWREMLKADQTTLANTWVPETTVIKEIKLIPQHCYRDGQVDISIERKAGDYAICAGLELIAYEDEKGGHHGGTQMGEISTLPVAYQFKLMQSVPNPTNGKAAIAYQIATESKVSLKVYNTLGQVVNTLVDEGKQPGVYQAIWNGKDNAGKAAAAGVYFYRLIAGDKTDIKKMVVIR